MHVTGQALSNRLRGKANWTADDFLATAEFFGITVNDLMPSRGVDGEWVPAPFKPGYAKAPTVGAGALSEPPVGIEPTTYSLRVNRSAD